MTTSDIILKSQSICVLKYPFHTLNFSDVEWALAQVGAVQTELEVSLKI